MKELITYEKKGYGKIKLNRAKKHHAISLNMAEQLKDVLLDIKTHPIPFLVLTSTGSTSFCAGGDLEDFHSSLQKDTAHQHLSVMQSVLKEIVAFPVPTICLLHGNAFGGGCELATACDIRIAKEGTSFGFVQTRLGILPGWGGGAILYERVTPAFAYDWLLGGEKYAAAYLYEKGWLQSVVPADEWENEHYLDRYTGKTNRQMSNLKAQYLEAMPLEQLYEKMDIETERCAALWGSHVHQQHVQQFLKR